MVVENLQIKPLMEWILGSGWSEGSLWQPTGFIVLLVLLVGGGLFTIFALRRNSAPPGPTASLWIGAIFGLLSLVLLTAVALCSTEYTRDFLNTNIASPLFARLVPLLGTEWTTGAIYTWLGIAAGLTGVVYTVAWLVSILVDGPATGTQKCGRAIVEIATDIARISPRRVYALGWLAVRESFRRRVVVVFVVFLILILFAALFIDKTTQHPAQLYIQIVLNFTIYETMLFALILSALSLPADIRDRTLHTVVTKPVRKIEIVLGRVLGFVFVGTVLLAAIGLISYGFSVRSLNHTHRLTPDMLQHVETLPSNGGILRRGLTTKSHGHEHEVTIIERPGEAPVASVETKMDHTHDLYVSGSGDTAVYTLSEPQGELQARVPIYAANLSFLDKTGKKKTEKGINVGDEWTYRSFIEGRTAAAAIWTFDNLREDDFPESKFPDGIPIEMTLEVFRTYKGNQEKGVAGTITFANPKTHKQVDRNFIAKKFATDTQIIPRSTVTAGRDGHAETIKLFRDLVSDDGRLEVIVKCLEPQQYYGMALPDLYIRAADSSFAWNFCKGYLGIWLQMTLVVALGVMFSTIVSGPVALIATMFVIVVGLCSSYVAEIAGGKIVGGGPFESAQRLMTQDNMITPLEKGLKSDTIKALDEVDAVMMRFLSALVPSVSENDFVDRVAYGFDVGRDLITRCLLCEVAYLVPVVLLGYICLRNREIAQ
jgi:hypothetical protein